MFENNLRNITNSNPIFNSTLNLISNYLPPDLKTLYFSNQQVPIISGDSYFIHYSVFPVLKPQNQDPTLEKARQVFQEYATSQRYQNLKSLTTLDHEVSLVYGISLTKLILEKIKEEIKQDLQKNGNQNPSQALQQMIMAVQNGDQNAQRQLQQLTQQALSDVLGDKKVQDIFSETEKTTRNAKEIKSLLGQKASKTGSSFEFLLGLAEQMKEIPDVRQIITLGNKISATFFSTHITKQKSRHGDELAGYGLTHSPIEALPRELALPDDLFYYKFASSGFLTREKQLTSEGAYYLLVDKSGSMGTSDKIIWSRSTALALYKLARAKRRDYYLQFFDISVYPSEPYTTPEEVLRSILKVKSEGGTSIDTALKTAISLLNKKYAQKTNSIIIITDGEDDVYTTKQQLGKIQLISVMIQGHNRTLQQLSSQFLKVTPDEKGALQLLEVANQ